jgi:hypothetical protein
MSATRVTDGTVTIELPSIGLGTHRTSATYAALFIALEGDRSAQIDVLDSVLEALNIRPEELIHNRKMPDCCDAGAFAAWQAEGDALRARLDAEQQSDAAPATNARAGAR